MDRDHQVHEGDHPMRIYNWILIGFFAIAGYFLILEHRAHLNNVLYFLPYILLLACPLMHVFMPHGHGEHRPPNDDQEAKK